MKKITFLLAVLVSFSFTAPSPSGNGRMDSDVADKSSVDLNEIKSEHPISIFPSSISLEKYPLGSKEVIISDEEPMMFTTLTGSSVNQAELSLTTTVVDGDSGGTAEFSAGTLRIDVDNNQIILRALGGFTIGVSSLNFTFTGAGTIAGTTLNTGLTSADQTGVGASFTATTISLTGLNGKVLSASTEYVFDVTFAASCSAPSAAATSAVFGSETSSTLNLTSFTAPAGGADGYAIYINDTNSFTAPSDGDEPVADLTWNGAGQQAVYFGTSASPNITVSDLDPGTTYYFQIYAYNDCSGTETYETTGLNANDTTALGVLTITGLTGGDKIYDDTTAASASGTASLNGVASGANDVSLGGSPVFTFASANVGTGITITTTGYTLSGTDAGKYTLTQPTLSGDITQKELTISGLTGGDKTYDDTTAASASGTASLVGVETGDDVSLGGSPMFTFASANVGTGITINTTGYTISGTDSGNYTLTQPTLSGDITAKELTITGLTGDNKVYDGTTAATASGTAILVGVETGDDVSLGGSPVFTFASANVGTGITINTTGYTISGTDSGNYTLTQPTLSADITGAELTIVGLTGDNKVYDGTTAATASGTAVLSGIIGADDVVLGGNPVFTFASANVGTGITMNTTGYTISGTDSGNYTLTQPTLSADITGAELTIVGLTGDNKVYDGTTAATASGTAVLSGIIGADDVVLGGSPVFTFASANVGTGITMNTSGYTISGTDSGNYTLTQPTLSADITGAELTIVGLTGDNKVYDGTTAATASGTAVLSGIIGADDVVLGGSPVFTFASANVGTGITMNTAGYTISGTDSGNYTLTQPTLSADITGAELTIVGLTGDNKVYDGTTAATASGTATLSGIIGADDVVLGGSPVFTFASANVGTGITMNTSGYTISGTDSGNYTLTQPTLSADITAAELTIVGLTGDNKVYDGTTAATASGTAVLSGIIGADDVVLGGSPVFTFASANVGTGITMNTSGYTISGTDSGNYTLTQPTLSADITGIALTISGLTGDNKVYDGTTAATASGTATLVGVVGGDDVSLGGSPVFTFASANVGTGITINTTGYTLSGADAGKYSLTQPTLSADITGAELTIVGLTGDNKVYDGTTAGTASGTATLSGIIGADDVIIGGSPVFTFASANVGTGITMNTSGYTISGTDSGNYTLTQPTLSADITGAELTIVGLTGDNKVYDGTTAATASGTAVLSGIIGADDVSLGGSPVFTFASANVGTGITMNTSGYTISGTDSGNYTLTQPTLSADITAAELTIVGLTGDNKVYDGTTAATASGTATLSGIIGADDVSLGGSPVFTFASANVGTGITMNTSGYTISGTDSGNYTLTQPTLSADITGAELTIVGLTGDNKVYDGTTAGTASGTAVLSGIIGADDVSLGGSPVFTFASANVGTGITVATSGYTISGTDSGNYTLTQPTLSADITAAELTIVGLTGDNKVYDGTTAATASGTATLSGIIGADDVSLGGSPVFTFASANVGTGITMNTSGYTISGTNSGNYTLTQPTLSADITGAELTIVGLTGDNKVYDGTTAATASGTATLSGIIGADDVILGGSPVFTFASADPGTGITINTTGYTISGTDSGNYTLTQPTLSADILGPDISFSATSSNALENSGTANITVDLSVAIPNTVTVDYTVTGGTASGSGTDYTLASGTLTFDPSTSSQDIALTLIDESIVEPDETVEITLSNPTNGSLGANTIHTFTITNDDTTVVTIADLSANENAGTQTITATLTNPVQGGFALDVFTTDGTATTADSDYSSTAGSTLTFAGTAGETQTLNLGGLGDTKVEADETFTISMTNVGFTSVNPANIDITDTATYTILNDDSATITIDNVIVSEDTGIASITLALDNEVDGGFDVDVSTADGTATTADSDYVAVTAATETFTGTAGETRIVDIVIGVDTKPEADELFNISMSGLISPTVSTSSIDVTDGAIVTILNDDNVQAVINDPTVNEGDSGTTSLTFTVTIDQAAPTDVSVDYSTSDGTAEAGSDYTAASGTVTIPTGLTSQTFTIDVSTDTMVETDETLTVTLSNPVGTIVILDATGTGTITNDDTTVVTIADLSVNENAGTQTITATLTNPVQGGFALDVFTTDGTATTADSDYSSTAGSTLTFAGTAGETQTLNLGGLGDTKVEADETFTISMTNVGFTSVNPANIDATSVATYTILNDDSATVTIDDVIVNEDTGIASITLALDNEVDGGFTIDASTTDGTATTTDSDYVAITSTETFVGTAGETQVVDIVIGVDTKVEADETFEVSMFSLVPMTVALSSIDTLDIGTVTILNDDSASITIADVSGNEDDGAITVSVSLDNAVQGGFTVDVSTADGTATTSDADYTAVLSETVSFSGTVGETQTFTVMPTADDKAEMDETLTIVQSNLSGTTLGVTITDEATITINNDDFAPIVAAGQIFTIDENSSNASSIGTILATDVDPGTSFGNWTIVSGNTDVDGDTDLPFEINMATGEITVNDSGDLDFESGTISFSLTVTVSDGTNTSIPETVIININDVDDVGTLTIADVSGNEDDGAITVSVTLDNPIQGGFTVDVSTADGTATTSDADYTAVVSETLIFSGTAGETQTFTIIPTADTTVETDETVSISMNNLGSAIPGSSITITDTATLTITNDDTAAVTIADVTGDEDNGDLIFTATLDNAVQGGFTVDVNTLDGTATVADGDYTAVSGQILTFAGTAGETQTFTVTPTVDNKVEEDEIVTIGMTTVDNTPSFNDIVITDIATATFTNDDSTEVVINGDVSVDEDAGNAVLTATLSNPVQGGFILNITTVDGTAVATSDYTGFNNGAIATFAGTAGETQDLLIPIIDDAQGELSEDFTVNLSFVDGTTLGGSITTMSTATVTIIDNDAPVVSAVSVPADGLYGIGTSLDFTVTFTDFVTTTGTPTIPITIGTSTVNAALTAPVANSLTATFSYTILEGEEDLDGIAVGTDIDLNGGTIIGSNSNIDAILTLNGTASSAGVNVDGIRPIPFVDSTVPDPTNAAFDVTITFDEPVTGFTVAGIDVGNGTASNLTGSGTDYTATITPAADGIVNIIILPESAFDAAGNGNDPSNEFSTEYDATRPVPTIASTTPDPTNTTFDVTITFTEDVTGFEVTDIDVTNGTADNFVSVSASEYTATITPAADGDVIVLIPENVSQDAATNGNEASNEFSVEYDTTPPAPPMLTHISDYTCAGTTNQTGDNTLEISGTAERESIVEIFQDGVSIGTIVTDAESGFFTFDYTSTTLSDGTYIFTAQATDTAVNTGNVSAPFEITINTVDSDGDGNPDFCDEDDDGNGDTDSEEDCDGDGIVDSQDNDNSSCRIPIQETRSYGFSPNGDGVNDGWVIENITAFPSNTVSLYSRSGKLVFRQSNYQNNFEGISNQVSGNGLGTKLPVGPYIYLIDLGDGSTPVRGWLYVNY